jgi:hypothetical protein
MSIARQREHAARTRAARGVTQLLDDRFEAVRVLAEAQFAELVDRAFQGLGQRTAIKADPDPFDPVIGAESQRDDRTGRVRVLQRRRQLRIFRDVKDLRAER